MLVGVDGGFSKTAAALAGDDGRIQAQVRGSGLVLTSHPTAATIAALSAILDGLCEAAGVERERIGHLALGLSGVDYADEHAGQHAWLAAGLGLAGERLTLVNDAVVALAGASPAARLAIAQHGTDFTSALRAGHGGEAVFDSLDVGAVFDLRRAAVQAAARMIDGRRERTGLLDAVLAHCGVGEDAFAAWTYREPAARGRIAALAPVVFAAWTDGDVAAAQLVDAAAADYALAAAAMGRRLGPGPFEAAFGGGQIAAGGPAFQEKIAAALVPPARWTPVRLAPELGAVALAGQRDGLDPATVFAGLEAGLSRASA